MYRMKTDRKEEAETDGFGFWAGLELETVYYLSLTYFISFLRGFSVLSVVQIPKTKRMNRPLRGDAAWRLTPRARRTAEGRDSRH